MDPSRADLDRLLESALGPVTPPPAVRERVLAAARVTPSRWPAFLRWGIPYAAGVLTVLALQSRPAPPPPVPTPVSYESIADRLPPPRPAPVEPVPEPAAFVPVPRIS